MAATEIYDCIILTGCTTGQVVYGQMSQIESAGYNFFNDEIGNIVEVNIGAPFQETYYTVTSVCSIFSEDLSCRECHEAMLLDTAYVYAEDPVTGYPLNVVPTELESCPGEAYVLVNCLNETAWENIPLDELIQSPTSVLVTNTDLQFYVGSVVNITEYPDKCFQVYGPYVQDTGCPCPVYTVTQSYQDCECCLPPAPPDCCDKITPNPVKVFYRVLQSRCDIKANVKFAEGYYRYFKHVAYGMGVCCDNIDIDKLWMKKELSDLNQIYDPSACVPPPAPEEPLECEGPTPTYCTPVDRGTMFGDIFFD